MGQHARGGACARMPTACHAGGRVSVVACGRRVWAWPPRRALLRRLQSSRRPLHHTAELTPAPRRADAVPASSPPRARLAPPAQAGSLAAALDDHNELPDLGEVSDHLSLSSNQRRARRIAVCTMGLTGLFMLGMVHLMHRSLREMREDHRAKEESETEALVQTPIRDTVSRIAV